MRLRSDHNREPALWRPYFSGTCEDYSRYFDLALMGINPARCGLPADWWFMRILASISDITWAATHLPVSPLSVD